MAKRAAYHHGDLRRALIAAAEKIVDREGPAALTLREAARAAGVSVAAPYRHFADKDALLAAVVTNGFEELARVTEAARARKRSSLRALESVGLAYVRFASENPSIYRLMFGPALEKADHPEALAAGRRALGVLLAAVVECQRSGEIAGDDPRQVALAGWSLCHGLASLYVDGSVETAGRGDVAAQAKALLGCLFDGVALRPARGRAPRIARRRDG